MQSVGTLILGLGLFFLGMQLVGDNLRRLSSASLPPLGARTRRGTWTASLLGTLFGAMMQSATAVTFVMVSMVGSGLVDVVAARPVIVWSNVGLTVLAFLVTLNIHPLVTLAVGLAGIAVGILKRPRWRTVAWIALGLTLILYGLQTMSAGVAPLRASAPFQAVLAVTETAPPLAFLAGIVIAALLQSNTGATLLIITLAAAGSFALPQAMLLIYGTNLGAIALRAVLAADLRGTALQLVRLEDLFCLWSGALMVALYGLEFGAGVPLVAALVGAATPDLPAQLALVFLLSNLLPALTLTPALGWCGAGLARRWPPEPGEREGQVKYVHAAALADPGTALGLLAREVARVFAHLRRLLGQVRPGAPLPVEHAARVEHFEALTRQVDAFIDRLAQQPLGPEQAARLRQLRDALSFARYAQEAALELADSLAGLPAGAARAGTRLRDAADALLALANEALDTGAPERVARLRESSAAKSPLLAEVRQACAGDLSLLTAQSDCERLAWLLHRLAKLLGTAA